MIALTFRDVMIGVHDGLCSCGRSFANDGDECTDVQQEKIVKSVTDRLLLAGALVQLSVNDEGDCRHVLSGCCWICGRVGDHLSGSAVWVPCPTGYTRQQIIDLLDGRDFK